MPTGELVVVPRLRGAYLELVERLRVDTRHVLERLADPVLGRQPFLEERGRIAKQSVERSEWGAQR